MCNTWLVWLFSLCMLNICRFIKYILAILNLNIANILNAQLYFGYSDNHLVFSLVLVWFEHPKWFLKKLYIYDNPVQYFIIIFSLIWFSDYCNLSMPDFSLDQDSLSFYMYIIHYQVGCISHLSIFFLFLAFHGLVISSFNRVN